MTINMITAQEAHNQGSGPDLFYSIARRNEDPAIVRVARQRARELADMLGIVRGKRRERAANDNNRRGRGANDNSKKQMGGYDRQHFSRRAA